MKTAKVIIGIVIAFFASITMFQMFYEESGAGLYGALTGYIIILAICIWLIYSGTKDNSKTNVIHNKVTNPAYDKLLTIKQLRDKGVLTEQEYIEKKLKIERENSEYQAKESKEYQQLKELLERGILTKDEFELKSQNFINNYKEIKEKEDFAKKQHHEHKLLETEKEKERKRKEGISWGWRIFYGLFHSISIIMVIYYALATDYKRKALQTFLSMLLGQAILITIILILWFLEMI